MISSTATTTTTTTTTMPLLLSSPSASSSSRRKMVSTINHQRYNNHSHNLKNRCTSTRWATAATNTEESTATAAPATGPATATTTAMMSNNNNNNNNDNNKMRGMQIDHTHCQSGSDRDILVRAARGERTERTPVWMMRQAGRYMQAFRQYSDRLPFRERSENVLIITELSIQCHRAYGMDGIIIFSDILTPLPVLGIEFDVVKGKGPIIDEDHRIRTMDDYHRVIVPNVPPSSTSPIYNFDQFVPFVGQSLQQLHTEANAANTALIGFVGAPLTLCAYITEGMGSKHCSFIKQMMLDGQNNENAVIHDYLSTMSHMIGQYAIYQIQHGAEIIQFFESWCHQWNPYDFNQYAKPAVLHAAAMIKQQYPDIPIIYYTNGGSSYLELQKDMAVINGGYIDMIGIDWHIHMNTARTILGSNVPISGNIDPSILKFGTQTQIENAVRTCIDDAGGPGNRHILNLGHGVMQGTPEMNVQYLVDECKRYYNGNDNNK
jgi:uroporphyrinogen decarboxylase